MSEQNSDFIELKCPSCGGILQIMADAAEFTCMYCGAKYMKREQAQTPRGPLEIIDQTTGRTLLHSCVPGNWKLNSAKLDTAFTSEGWPFTIAAEVTDGKGVFIRYRSNEAHTQKNGAAQAAVRVWRAVQAELLQNRHGEGSEVSRVVHAAALRGRAGGLQRDFPCVFKGGWRAGIAKHDQHRLSNGEEAHPRSGRFPLPHDPAHLHDEPAGQRRSAEGRAGAAGAFGHCHNGYLCSWDAGNQAHLSAADGQGGSQEVVPVRQNFPLFFLIREKSRESILLPAGKTAGNAVFSGTIRVTAR